MFSVPSSDLSNMQPAMPFDVVVIGASLGGIQALSEILGHIPADFPIPLIVVQHLSPHFTSHLVEILNSRTPLAVQWAESGMCLQAGNVYLAPPNWHVLVNQPGKITLRQTPEVQFARPSVNLLFESVAKCYRRGTERIRQRWSQGCASH